MLMEENKKNRKILKKLKNKYRLVIMNDTSFEEKFSYRLSPLNIVTLVLTLAFILMGTVAALIVFTPLREYIPGYTDVTLRQELTKMVLKSDSLEEKLMQNNLYLNNIQTILRGDTPDSDLIIEDSLHPISGEVIKSAGTADRSIDDSLLREYVEREDAYSINVHSDFSPGGTEDLFFFTPLKGPITNDFDPKNNHFGVDIVSPKNETIKACLDGTVIFADWTVGTGYVIQLQHKDNLSSIYKHNSILLKEVGKKVKAGEAIAIVGNSGELTTGPHLHFELWKDGIAINPTKYINFN